MFGFLSLSPNLVIILRPSGIESAANCCAAVNLLLDTLSLPQDLSFDDCEVQTTAIIIIIAIMIIIIIIIIITIVIRVRIFRIIRIRIRIIDDNSNINRNSIGLYIYIFETIFRKFVVLEPCVIRIVFNSCTGSHFMRSIGFRFTESKKLYLRTKCSGVFVGSALALHLFFNQINTKIQWTAEVKGPRGSS